MATFLVSFGLFSENDEYQCHEPGGSSRPMVIA